MRINLVTPFAEKDAVKALGARWDAAKKTWYITDVTDLAPFARWIPDLAAATESAVAGTTRPAVGAQQSSNQAAKKPITTKPTVEVPHCGCDVLPWVDCPHTAAPRLEPTSQ